MNDPDDLLDPAELAQEASRHLLSALAALDDLNRSLRGDALPSPQPRCNVVLLSARPGNHRRRRNARTGL